MCEPGRSPIRRIDLHAYDLSYVGGEYVMSGGRVVTTLSSTVVHLVTEDGVSGFGETCPLGSNYLPGPRRRRRRRSSSSRRR